MWTEFITPLEMSEREIELLVDLSEGFSGSDINEVCLRLRRRQFTTKISPALKDAFQVLQNMGIGEGEGRWFSSLYGARMNTILQRFSAVRNSEAADPRSACSSIGVSKVTAIGGRKGAEEWPKQSDPLDPNACSSSLSCPNRARSVRSKPGAASQALRTWTQAVGRAVCPSLGHSHRRRSADAGRGAAPIRANRCRKLLRKATGRKICFGEVRPDHSRRASGVDCQGNGSRPGRLADIIENNDTDRMTKELSCADTIEPSHRLSSQRDGSEDWLRRSRRGKDGFIAASGRSIWVGMMAISGGREDFEKTCRTDNVRMSQDGYSEGSLTYEIERGIYTTSRPFPASLAYVPLRRCHSSGRSAWMFERELLRFLRLGMP